MNSSMIKQTTNLAGRGGGQYTTIWHRVHDMGPEIKLTYDEVEAQMALDPRQCWGYRTFVYGKIRESA